MKKVKKALGESLPIVGGAIGAKLVKNVAGKMIQNETVKSALPLVVGLLLMGSKGKTMQGVGAGMVAVGGADLAGSFVPALKGIEDMDLSGIFDELRGNTLNGATLNDEINDDISSIEDEQY